MSDDWIRQRVTELRTSSALTQTARNHDRDPDRVARSQEIGASLNVPPRAVEEGEEEFQRLYYQRQNARTIQQHPWMAQYLGQGDNAALVGNELPAVGKAAGNLPQNPVNNLGETGRVALGLPQHSVNIMMERARPAAERDFGELAAAARGQSRQPEANAKTVTTGLAAGVASTVLSTGLGAARYVTDAIGVGDEVGVQDYFREQSQSLQAFNERSTPQFDTTLGRGVYGGASSLLNLGAMATMGSGAILPLFGATTGLSEYNRFRERGATPNEALAGGAAMGAIEVATELLPMGFLINRFGKVGGRAFVAGLLGREIPTELIATASQSAVDVMVPGSGRTWEDYRRDLPNELLETMIATTTMVGLAGTANAAMLRLRREVRAQEDATQGLQGQAVLDNLMTDVQGIKMRERAPQQFAEMIAAASEQSPVKNVYVPVEAIATYLQSEGADPAVFERYQDQITEAQQTQGDVVIPVGEAAAYLAGTPAWEAIREEVRVTPGGMSGREARERRETMLQQLEEIGAGLAEEGEAAATEVDPKLQVFNEVRNRALAAGLQSREAETTALLVAEHSAAMAAQLEGETALSYWNSNQIEIERATQAAAQPAATTATTTTNSPAATTATTATTTPEVAAPIEVTEEERNDPLFASGAQDAASGQPRRFLADEAQRRLYEAGYQSAEQPRAVAQFNQAATVEELADTIPGLSKILPHLLEDERAKLKKRSAEKLLAIFETLPDAEEMASVAFAGRAKRGWYENSAQAIVEVFGLEDGTRFAALLAATSPQNSVEMNAINALNIWVNWDKAGRPTEAKAIKKIMGQSVVGNKGEASVLDAWVNNTYAALSAENPAEIILSGPKVNSFFANLVGVTDEVTNDAWMANYALIEPSTFKGAENRKGPRGKSAGYMAFSALVRQAADILTQRTGSTWTPAEVQETVWSLTKAVTETRAGAGRITTQQLLEQGLITDADIAATPDFAQLFQGGIFRKILEAGGYGEEIEALGAPRNRPVDGSLGGERPVADPEGAGIDGDTFWGHLLTLAQRIEERVSEQLAGSGRGSALGKARKRGTDAQLDLFAQAPAQTPLEGLKTRVKVNGVPMDFGPFAPAREAARRYALRYGLPFNPPTDYVAVDEARATRIAAEFEAMEHNPDDPEVKRAYRAMIDETVAQWRMIKETGLQVDFIEGEDPYGNPRNAILDVVQNNHLWVYPTDAGFGGAASADVDVSGNPLLEIVPGEKINGRPVRANDLFRIVHDYFGHIKEGVGFRADGEENAWRIHSSMYSPLARRAMTTETRGQNSWVNYGPHGEFNRTASGAETEYAPQKIGLLPDWVVQEGAGVRTFNQDVIPIGGWTEDRIGGLISDHGYSMNDNSKAYATLMTPDEFLGLTASPEGRAVIEERVATDYGDFDQSTYDVSLPITITVDFMQRFGQVMGHEGRHRMTMLKNAGAVQVPVVVSIQNGRSDGTDREPTRLMPQRSRSSQIESGDTPTDSNLLIPINWKNRDRLLDLAKGKISFEDGAEEQDFPSLEELSRVADMVAATPRARQLQQTVRGQASFFEDGRTVITLFDTADFSTMIHELGHVFLEQMVADAQRPNASKQLKEDVAKIKGWFAANGHEVRNGVIPVEAHELFARSFERYAREGKAPSPELRGTFTTFRRWLTAIYKSVQALRAPITDDIRRVMDRMLATEEAIAANVVAPMSQEQLGMTSAEYAAYLESVQGVRDEAFDTLLEKMMAAIRRRENRKMNEQRANVRAEVAAEINAMPIFQALHLLRTGRWLGDPEREALPIKLNTGWLIDTYGEEVLDQLPKGLPIARGDGVDGDTVAEIVGMNSGDELVQALLQMRRASDALRAEGWKSSLRDKAIEDATDTVMAGRHGDVAMSDEAIEEEAIAAINSQRQGEVIATEIRQLRKRTQDSGAPTPYQIAREWARRKVNAGRVAEVASRSAVQRYIRATNKAQRAAEEAILAGKTDEAFRQKQAQMLNHALLAESKAAADEVEAIVKRLRTLGGRKSMKSVDQDYMDRIHEVLEAYDFRPRSQRSIDEQTGFMEWAAAQQKLGREVHVPPRLMERGQPYSRITVGELLELGDTIQSLVHLGRVKQKIKDAQAERDFNELRDEIVANVSALPDRKLPETPIDEERRIGASGAAALLKIETLADELDNGDPNGPLNRLLVQRATAAATERDQLTESVMVPLARLYHSLTKKQRKRLDEKVTIPELTWNTVNEGDPRRGKTVTMTRMQLLAVALNSGNVSNLEKMSRGERWPATTIQAVLRRELNKDDWDFVHAVWRGVEKLWPDIARVERELSGVVPEQVVPMDIETPFGPYQGGYWPVVYDSTRSQRAENNAQDEANDLFGFSSGVGTPKGHTITRTNAIGPIDFSLEHVLLTHIEKVVTRIAYATFARDVLRVIENPKIRGIIDTKLGAEYRKQVKPWLKRQIAANAIDRRGSAWWEKVLRGFRTNMSITTMGLAYSTGVAQTLGLGFSAGRIGPQWVALGLKRMVHPTEGWGAAQAFVFSRSPEMQRRGHEMNREVVEVFQRLRGGATWYTHAQAMAFWHIAMIDRYMVAMPTWLGAHARGISEGMTDEEASAYADKAVRLSQGSGREKDLSAVQSPNSEAFRFLTMFYTPFNVQFNAQWEAVRAGKKGDWRKAMILSTFFLGTTALADALMSGDWPEDEDEDGLPSVGELAGWFTRNIFFSLWAGIPIVRDAANVGERKLRGEYGEWGQTPISSAFKSGERAYTEADQVIFDGEELTSEFIRAEAMAAGYALGLPGNQLGKTGGFLWDVSQGHSEPETVKDWYYGITSGKTPEDE